MKLEIESNELHKILYFEKNLVISCSDDFDMNEIANILNNGFLGKSKSIYIDNQLVSKNEYNPILIDDNIDLSTEFKFTSKSNVLKLIKNIIAEYDYQEVIDEINKNVDKLNGFLKNSDLNILYELYQTELFHVDTIDGLLKSSLQVEEYQVLKSESQMTVLRILDRLYSNKEKSILIIHGIGKKMTYIEKVKLIESLIEFEVPFIFICNDSELLEILFSFKFSVYHYENNRCISINDIVDKYAYSCVDSLLGIQNELQMVSLSTENILLPYLFKYLVSNDKEKCKEYFQKKSNHGIIINDFIRFFEENC